MLPWSEFSCVSGTIFVFSVPALHPPLSPHQSPTWTCSSSYPLACFYILAVASPPVPDRSACRGLCRLQTHTSCSSPVAPLFSVPERAIFLLLRWLLCFFFSHPCSFIALCSSFCVFPEDILSPALAAVLHAGFSSPFSLPYSSLVKPVFTDLYMLFFSLLRFGSGLWLCNPPQL